MYRQDFRLQTLTVSGPVISPLCRLVPHRFWFWFCVRLEVQESEVRHFWHCRIWPWPQWTVVEQYVSEILIQPCFDRLVVRYVEKSTTGFPLYRKDHLQTSVSQVYLKSLQTWTLVAQSSLKGTCLPAFSSSLSHIGPALNPSVSCASLELYHPEPSIFVWAGSKVVLI